MESLSQYCLGLPQCFCVTEAHVSHPVTSVVGGIWEKEKCRNVSKLADNLKGIEKKM